MRGPGHRAESTKSTRLRSGTGNCAATIALPGFVPAEPIVVKEARPAMVNLVHDGAAVEGCASAIERTLQRMHLTPPGEQAMLIPWRGQWLRIELLLDNLVRIRCGVEHEPAPTLTERYGLVRAEWPGCELEVAQRDGQIHFRSKTVHGVVDEAEGTVTVTAPGRFGTRVLRPLPVGPPAETEVSLRRERVPELFGSREAGPVGIVGDTGADRIEGAEAQDEAAQPGGLLLDLDPAERFYGLGTPSKEHIQLRGLAIRNWVRYQQAEGPVPFCLSTSGWGLFLNTTRDHIFDLGASDTGRLFAGGEIEALDCWLLIAPPDDALPIPALLNLFTEITGRPTLLPAWGYGLTYVGHIFADQHDLLNDVLGFRQREIPMEILGLEPGWMEKFYDFSTAKRWNNQRFYVEDWMRQQRAQAWTFLGALRRYAVNVSLWLCCQHDLTAEAERRAGAELEGPEPWFDHLKAFVDDGVRAFKLDPARYVDTLFAGRVYANGRTDVEMHNLMQSLLVKQMYEGFSEHTGLRPMHHYCGAYTGVQRWTATTAGDSGGGATALTWMLSQGLTAHMNTSCDMDVLDPAGIHFGFLMPWSQVNSWCSVSQPWWLGPELEPLFAFYANLRARLMPYLYSELHAGHRSGMPLLRAMPLAWPDDLRLSDCTTQYLLGGALLAAAFTRHLTIPEGVWFDYWTGERIDGPAEIEYQVPHGRGGALLVRAGSPIPCRPAGARPGENPKQLEIEVFTQAGKAAAETRSELILTEDDGESLGYLRGETSQARITCVEGEGEARVIIERRSGGFPGMAAERTYVLQVHGPEPEVVIIDSRVHTHGLTGWAYADGVTRVVAPEPSSEERPCVVRFIYPSG